MRRWKRKEINREIWNDVDENRFGEEAEEESPKPAFLRETLSGNALRKSRFGLVPLVHSCTIFLCYLDGEI